MNRYFTLLGLTPNATLQDIKKAYRKKVMLYHPDRNKTPGAREKFIEIDQAYDYLCNLRLGKIQQPVFYTHSPQTAAQKETKKRKERKKNQLKKEFIYQMKSLDRQAYNYYLAICIPSMLILPFVGVGIGVWLNSKTLGVILFLCLPIAVIYYLCKKVYNSFIPKRERLTKMMRKKMKAL